MTAVSLLPGALTLTLECESGSLAGWTRSIAGWGFRRDRCSNTVRAHPSGLFYCKTWRLVQVCCVVCSRKGRQRQAWPSFHLCLHGTAGCYSISKSTWRTSGLRCCGDTKQSYLWLKINVHSTSHFQMLVLFLAALYSSISQTPNWKSKQIRVSVLWVLSPGDPPQLPGCR